MPGTHPAKPDGVADPAGQNLEALKRQLATLHTDLAGLSQLLLGQGSDGVMSHVRKVAEGGKGAIAVTEQKVRAWPLLSLLLAFLVGLLFGRVVARK